MGHKELEERLRIGFSGGYVTAAEATKALQQACSAFSCAYDFLPEEMKREAEAKARRTERRARLCRWFLWL